VNWEGSHSNLKKVTVIEGFPISKTMINVQVFLGLVGYYKKFILGYDKIVGPLFELTKKDHKFS
jgi:hypothetical protein